MARRHSTRSILCATLISGLVMVPLGGCALFQPPPAPRMPSPGLRAYRTDASCAADIAQAHAALAAAGAAAGDPVATAAAHSASAAAMHAYHVCLAQSGRP